jgi:hypothetical protein
LLNYQGTECPHVEENIPGQVSPCCPVNCVFEYQPWTPCSAEGYRRRNVHIVTPASCGGAACPACTVERDDCTPPPADVPDCWLENCDDVL